MTMINDDKDDDLDIYYPHSDAPKPAWPSADRGGNRFSASSLRLPWVNPLQTLQTLPFPLPGLGQPPSNSTIPLLPLQILPQTQVNPCFPPRLNYVLRCSSK